MLLFKYKGTLRNLLLISLAFLTLACSKTPDQQQTAQEISEQYRQECLNTAEVAKLMMKVRIKGALLEKVLEGADVVQKPETKKLVHTMARDAFSRPLPKTKAEQQKLIDDFGDQWGTSCMKKAEKELARQK